MNNIITKYIKTNLDIYLDLYNDINKDDLINVLEINGYEISIDKNEITGIFDNDKDYISISTILAYVYDKILFLLDNDGYNSIYQITINEVEIHNELYTQDNKKYISPRLYNCILLNKHTIGGITQSENISIIKIDELINMNIEANKKLDNMYKIIDYQNTYRQITNFFIYNKYKEVLVQFILKFSNSSCASKVSPFQSRCFLRVSLTESYKSEFDLFNKFQRYFCIDYVFIDGKEQINLFLSIQKNINFIYEINNFLFSINKEVKIYCNTNTIDVYSSLHNKLMPVFHYEQHNGYCLIEGCIDSIDKYCKYTNYYDIEQTKYDINILSITYDDLNLIYNIECINSFILTDIYKEKYTFTVYTHIPYTDLVSVLKEILHERLII